MKSISPKSPTRWSTAILDYTSPVGVADDEWLTVAARESVVNRRVMPGDPGDTAITIILRIKGRDLNAVRDRQLSSEEARKRVEVKQYLTHFGIRVWD